MHEPRKCVHFGHGDFSHADVLKNTGALVHVLVVSNDLVGGLF